MNDVDRQVIRALQANLPIVSRPFSIVAGQIGLNENDFLAKTNELLRKGVIRKIGAVLHHRQIGLDANALCLWIVPADKVAVIGEMFAQMSVVTHCYERSAFPDWPYNLYTMVHAKTRPECEQIINDMATKAKVYQYKIFYSTQELKKTSMRYFE